MANELDSGCRRIALAGSETTELPPGEARPAVHKAVSQARLARLYRFADGADEQAVVMISDIPPIGLVCDILNCNGSLRFFRSETAGWYRGTSTTQRISSKLIENANPNHLYRPCTELAGDRTLGGGNCGKFAELINERRSSHVPGAALRFQQVPACHFAS
jgi:hypothetical protein